TARMQFRLTGQVDQIRKAEVRVLGQWHQVSIKDFGGSAGQAAIDIDQPRLRRLCDDGDLANLAASDCNRIPVRLRLVYGFGQIAQFDRTYTL
ncbi:MAG: hypothetical protein ABEK42_13465, partial [Thiohalorhabdaceae bacterium]